MIPVPPSTLSWHRVNESQPDDGIEVLGSDGEHFYLVGLDAGEWKLSDDDERVVQIKCWAHLPDPPKS